MPVIAVIGAQWGDEGKGKIVDLLAARAQVVARSQGGANAGHTIRRDDRKIVLHLLPSGVLSPTAQCLIGPGVVVDAEELIEELGEIEALGLSLQGRLTVDLRAHIVFPTHKQIEVCQEKALGNDRIGTTSRGIGPAYCDKAARRGVRVGDLLNAEIRKRSCSALYEHHAKALKSFFKEQPPSREEFLKQAERWAETLSLYAGDAVRSLREAVAADQMVLLEGAQGTLLDLDLGTYPFVTSSHPTVGGPVIGLGLPPRKIDYVLGVLKAYCTRVGSGPFPTEMDEETASAIREKGAEYGATTGRPRRIGWLDLVAAREAANWNGISGWAITKLDVLDGLKSLQLCYEYRLGGQALEGAPLTTHDWEAVQANYESLPGWDDGQGVREYNALPANARAYLERIASFTGVPIQMISLGAGQEATISAGKDSFHF